MEIRKVMAYDDFKAIGDVYTKSWQNTYRNILSEAYLESLNSDSWNPNKRYTHFIILVDNQIIGTASTCHSRDDDLPDWAELASIYLLPEYTHQRYGSNLLDYVINALQQEGYHKLFLWVLDSNTPAKGFYQRKGFTRTHATRFIDIANQSLLALRYTRSL